MMIIVIKKVPLLIDNIQYLYKIDAYDVNIHYYKNIKIEFNEINVVYYSPLYLINELHDIIYLDYLQFEGKYITYKSNKISFEDLKKIDVENIIIELICDVDNAESYIRGNSLEECVMEQNRQINSKKF